ncbi:MAG TPA: ABC transporter ATP-binding protein [Acidimicrobiales bacterium]|nr:ABC transporter ATP-binding protein [Acidimicrobiales bacterium]
MSAAAPAPPTPVVATAGVVKWWGSTLALAGAEVVVGTGVTGLLGANGSGKTTLFGLLLGLHRPDEGTIRVLGLDPTEAGPEVRARVGYSPEHHSLPPDVKAVDFVRHVGELHGLPRREATGRASDVLWQVGLGEERIRPLGTMSTGQRQRVKLAQAIVHDPVLVLLDEPTEGLDPVQRDDMLALIRRVGHDFGIHVILSSHVLDEVERVADGAVILHAGQVVSSGSLSELQASSTGGVVLEVAGDPEPFYAAIRSHGVPLYVDGDRIFVEGGEDAFDLVRDELARLDLPVRRLEPRRRSLEEVFLSAGLTGGQARAGATS